MIDSLGGGGAEALLAEFAGQAAEAGIDVSVGNLKPSLGDEAANRLRAQGIKPHVVPVSRLGLRDFRRVRRHIARIAPDLVHTHLGASDCLGTAAARSLGVPAVSTLHAAEWRVESLRLRAQLRLSALARRRCASRVIAVSEAARRTYLATGWAERERVEVIHNGVAGQATPGAGRAVRRELGIPIDAPVVAMVSHMRPEKRHELALAALPALEERFPGVRLLVAGDGPTRPRVERLARAHGEAVVMLGHRDDVMEILDSADVLLHPSRIEAFPNALLEAMAASVPIVATTVGGISEIVRHGECGLLVEPDPEPARLAKEVGRLLGDAEARARMGSAGRRRFDRCFTLERWVQKTRALYEDVLVERGRLLETTSPARAAGSRPSSEPRGANAP
ncbi:MAG: glycosyltransferase family 4 protein [Chloroflexota bacterium]|nr:glycosyltransferase family 4 protein [Chloroflexota bacterium]